MLPKRRTNSRSWRRIKMLWDSLCNRMFISFETKIFNKSMFDLGIHNSRYLKPWFGIGTLFAIMSMVLAIILMLSHIIGHMVRTSKENTEVGMSGRSEQVVTLVVPGVNVPWGDLPYMILATTFSVGFHELGHAMAAASEGVHIEHVAVFLACLVPGALVALDDDSLQLLNPVSALRIYCAGIWHNIVCCFSCYLAWLLLPLLLFPFYAYCGTPVILSIDRASPLASHVRLGDAVSEVGGSKLAKSEDWVAILHSLYLSYVEDTREGINLHPVLGPSYYVSSRGFSVDKGVIMQQNLSDGSACSMDALALYKFSDSGRESATINSTQSTFCLKAAEVISNPSCTMLEKNKDSFSSSMSSEKRTCLFPIVRHGEVFIDIKLQRSNGPCSVTVRNDNCSQSIVYVGDPRDLHNAVKLAKFWPRQISLFGMYSLSFWRSFPIFWERLIAYTFSISAAMVMLNSAPVFYLDGEAILKTCLSFNRNILHTRTRKKLIRVILTCGSVLLSFILIHSFLITML